MKTILIVEDDIDIIDTIRFVLMNTGYVVLSTMNSTPMSFIEELKPNLILLDYHLHNLSGKNLCIAIKTNYKTSDIPVIFISGDANIPYIAAKCGADAFIEKPFDIDKLIFTIERFF